MTDPPPPWTSAWKDRRLEDAYAAAVGTDALSRQRDARDHRCPGCWAPETEPHSEFCRRAVRLTETLERTAQEAGLF